MYNDSLVGIIYKKIFYGRFLLQLINQAKTLLKYTQRKTNTILKVINLPCRKIIENVVLEHSSPSSCNVDQHFDNFGLRLDHRNFYSIFRFKSTLRFLINSTSNLSLGRLHGKRNRLYSPKVSTIVLL